MQTITHTLDTTEDVILIPMADLHVGDPNCDYKLIRDTIARIVETPNCYTILDGDCMNNAVMGSPSSVYTETMSPMDQLKVITGLFKPLAEQGKILAILPGNHELRSSKTCGVDLTEMFAVQLGLGHLYSPTSALVYLRFGQRERDPKAKNSYTLFIYHGAGGGRRPGSKINRLQDMSQVIADADVYICGHTHMPASFRDQVLITEPKHNTVTHKDRLYVNTCSYLDWSGSYGDRMGLPPQAKTPPEIVLKAKAHEVRVIV